MKFVLIDRISELESGKRIVARKALSLAEEYLADHFPAAPAPAKGKGERNRAAEKWLGQ